MVTSIEVRWKDFLFFIFLFWGVFMSPDWFLVQSLIVHWCALVCIAWYVNLMFAGIFEAEDIWAGACFHSWWRFWYTLTDLLSQFWNIISALPLLTIFPSGLMGINSGSNFFEFYLFLEVHLWVHISMFSTYLSGLGGFLCYL